MLTTNTNLHSANDNQQRQGSVRKSPNLHSVKLSSPFLKDRHSWSALLSLQTLYIYWCTVVAASPYNQVQSTLQHIEGYLDPRILHESSLRAIALLIFLAHYWIPVWFSHMSSSREVALWCFLSICLDCICKRQSYTIRLERLNNWALLNCSTNVSMPGCRSEYLNPPAGQRQKPKSAWQTPTELQLSWQLCSPWGGACTMLASWWCKSNDSNRCSRALMPCWEWSLRSFSLRHVKSVAMASETESWIPNIIFCELTSHLEVKFAGGWPRQKSGSR